jgi:hypothetical protein
MPCGLEDRPAGSRGIERDEFRRRSPLLIREGSKDRCQSLQLSLERIDRVFVRADIRHPVPFPLLTRSVHRHVRSERGPCKALDHRDGLVDRDGETDVLR